MIGQNFLSYVARQIRKEDCAMSSEWQSVADQPVAPADNRPFILDCLHHSQDTSNHFICCWLKMYAKNGGQKFC